MKIFVKKFVWRKKKIRYKSVFANCHNTAFFQKRTARGFFFVSAVINYDRPLTQGCHFSRHENMIWPHLFPKPTIKCVIVRQRRSPQRALGKFLSLKKSGKNGPGQNIPPLFLGGGGGLGQKSNCSDGFWEQNKIDPQSGC